VLKTYRDVLAVPGAKAFVSAGFVARLPIAMIGLGIVIYISGITGSYGRAGLLTAIYAVAAAVFPLFTSRWMDRVGQRRVLPGLILTHGVALIIFVLLVTFNQSVLLQGLVVGIAGAAMPSTGSLVRARWVYVLRSPMQIRSAFALESILDEVMFTIGPLLTTVLALQVALPLPIVLGAGLAVVGSLALSALRGSEPPPNPRVRSAEPATPTYRQPGLLLMVFAALGVGAVFGSYEVSVVAFARALDQSGSSGIILALFAAGSMVGGLWFGSRHWHIPLPQQLPILTGIFVLVLFPLPWLSTVPLLAGASIVAGLATAPVLIAIFSLTQHLVPPRQLTEGLTWANSGLALGFSIGAAVGGILIDQFGTRWSFTLTVGGAALATLIAFLGRTSLLQAMHPINPDTPAIALNEDPIPGPTAGSN
jgi:MFS family permease